MHAVEAHEHARKLYDALGPKALLEAARQVRELEARGAKDDAADWRRIEAALKEMRGPRAS